MSDRIVQISRKILTLDNNNKITHYTHYTVKIFSRQWLIEFPSYNRQHSIIYIYIRLYIYIICLSEKFSSLYSLSLIIYRYTRYFGVSESDYPSYCRVVCRIKYKHGWMGLRRRSYYCTSIFCCCCCVMAIILYSIADIHQQKQRKQKRSEMKFLSTVRVLV